MLSRVRDTDVDAMIVKADLALYKAKELGKNDWRLFEAAMDAAFRNRQLMKADLRDRGRGGQVLRVVYQPIVTMETMRIASCEALCRWDHRDLGPISPAIFIPLAEEMGIDLGDQHISCSQAACANASSWPEQIERLRQPVGQGLPQRGTSSRRCRRRAGESGLAPHRLEIEVTETALLDDKSLTRQYIEELKTARRAHRARRFRHRLFEPQLSAQAAARQGQDRPQLPQWTSTQNTRSLELLKGIVNLSRPLGLTVTVEGVETFEQLKILALEVKPDLVQGFLFGSALSASGIETMSSTVWPFAKDIRDAAPRSPASSRPALPADLSRFPINR